MDDAVPDTPPVPFVGSEIGPLREVIVHRPGAELERLTPATMDELLWDDLLWVSRAQDEHDAFVGVLEDAGVLVHQLPDLLTQTLAVPEARAHVLNATFTREHLGPSLAPALLAHADSLDDAELAGVLVAGLTGREVADRLGGVDTLPLHVRGPEALILGPLPNHLFTRDASCWVYDGVAVNSMRYAARVRESVHYEAIYRWHPRFAELRLGGTADETGPGPGEVSSAVGTGRPAGRGFHRWAAGPAEGAANVEGGDVLVVGGGAVVVGMSERTTPQGVEHLAARMFAAGSADRVLALAMPSQRELMHLDTAMTMVDERTFLLYGGLGDLPSFTLTPDGAGDVTVTDHAPERMQAVLAEIVGHDDLRFLTPDLDARTAAREQWDDGCNALALAPGVAVTYDRAPASNAHLRANGIEVIEVPGGELGRGRGGPRCMSCPVVREAR
ncbi:arginine deiminase family protein [Georgenia sp. Z1491]|uniref:arginine deiminase n=1 Tax=Georgenia sp. Z1491 TaxID=3416707 RepID=UPI003CF09E76